MSVINKMLRDLDSRQTGADTSAPPGIARDTLIVSDSGYAGRSTPASPRKPVLLAVFGALLAGVMAAWWYLERNVAAPIPVVAASRPSAPAGNTVVSAVIPRADPVPSLAAASLPIAAAPPASMPAPVTASMSAPVPAAAPAAAPAPAPPTSPAQADSSLKMDSTFRSVPTSVASTRTTAGVTPRTAPARAPSAAASTAAAMPARQNLPRESPALEALAQAQNLWNEGSHEAAIDLAAEALALAERANAAGAATGNASVLTALARELARMELAQGRVSQALAMLTRLEPVLKDVADVWALRGNAAQRLGLHQESAAAYMTALKLKANEPRWMLGAAVSLAAQGQTAAAAELAEKARAAGVVSPEVATYLRQLGVPLGER